MNEILFCHYKVMFDGIMMTPLFSHWWRQLRKLIDISGWKSFLNYNFLGSLTFEPA